MPHKKTAFDRHAKIGETLRRLMRLLVNSGFSGPVCFLLADRAIVRQGKRKVKNGDDSLHFNRYAAEPRLLAGFFLSEKQLLRIKNPELS